MKPLPKHLKLIALFLAVTFLVQSCKIYKSNVSTVEEAVAKKSWVKIKSTNNETYKFSNLFIVDEILYGTAKSNRRTSKLLSDQIVSSADNPQYDVQIQLYKEQIKELHLLNPFLTSISPVFIIGGALIVFTGIVAITGVGLGPVGF